MNATNREFRGLRIWGNQVLSWTVHGLKNTVLYALLVAILFGLVYFDGAIFNCKEQDIRGVGLLFQIIGFTLVVLKLVTRRKLFQKPSFFARLEAYFGGFPSPFAKTFNIEARMTGVGGTMSASLGVKGGSNATLEERIEMLESEVEALNEKWRKTDRALRDHKIESKRSFDEVRQEIKTGDNKLEKLIDEAVVGGIGLEWIGILYFTVGISLATASSEISTYLGFLGRCGLPVG